LLYSVLGGSTPSQAAEKVGFGRCFEGATLGASLTEAFGRGERGAEPGLFVRVEQRRAQTDPRRSLQRSFGCHAPERSSRSYPAETSCLVA
jgi:hypothetical protein